MLESCFASDFADRYWALVRSGIQSSHLVVMDQLKDQIKTSLIQILEEGLVGLELFLHSL